MTLLDRGGPGEGASSGNLGGFGLASCPPLAMPGVLRNVPGMLLDDGAPLRTRPQNPWHRDDHHDGEQASPIAELTVVVVPG